MVTPSPCGVTNFLSRELFKQRLLGRFSWHRPCPFPCHFGSVGDYCPNDSGVKHFHLAGESSSGGTDPYDENLSCHFPSLDYPGRKSCP